MSGPVLGVAAAVHKLTRKAEQRTYARAVQGSEIAVALHLSSPRTGPTVNRYGQLRSAPGEQPAVEEGTLLTLLQATPTPVPGLNGNGHKFLVNYAVLELGTRHIAPRPLGAMTVAHLKREVSGGGGM